MQTGPLSSGDDPTQYSIPRAANAGLPLFIPWQRDFKPVTCGFDPGALEKDGQQGPWKPASAFSERDIWSLRCHAQFDCGTARAVEGHSGSNSITSEHLSGSFGVTAGNAAASVNVTAAYDKRMDENTSASRASHNSRYRCGRIVLAEDPPLSASVRELLRSKNGPKVFEELYGTYYVAGYVLGADSGACLVAASSSKQDTATTRVTANVKVLWSEFSQAESHTENNQTCSVDLTFFGYDSLDGTSHALRAEAGQSTEHIRLAARECMGKANALHHRVEERVKRLGIDNGKLTTLQPCYTAVQSGLVVELILMPFQILKEYVQCVYEGVQERRLKGVVEAK